MSPEPPAFIRYTPAQIQHLCADPAFQDALRDFFVQRQAFEQAECACGVASRHLHQHPEDIDALRLWLEADSQKKIAFSVACLSELAMVRLADQLLSREEK